MFQLIDLKTALVIVHLGSLAIGLGGALLMGLVVCRFFVRQSITQNQYDLVAFAANVVFAGLIGLWMSGLGFLGHYYFFDSSKLADPKLWAKISIVLILTLNGLYVHAKAIPSIRRSIGSTLLTGVTPHTRALIITSGCISLVSWIFPVVLGAIQNPLPGVAFADGYLIFFGAYLVFLISAILCGFLVEHCWLTRRSTTEQLVQVVTSPQAMDSTLPHANRQTQIATIPTQPIEKAA